MNTRNTGPKDHTGRTIRPDDLVSYRVNGEEYRVVSVDSDPRCELMMVLADNPDAVTFAKGEDLTVI